MDKIKCITFDKEAQDALPQWVKDKMKADRKKAELKEKVCTDPFYTNCKIYYHKGCNGCLKFKHSN